VQLCRPSGHVNKAVADGAVLSYIDPLVTSRTSRHTYGIQCNTSYNSSLAEHREREQTQFTLESGQKALPNAFQAILKKGVHVSEQQEFRQPFFKEGNARAKLTRVQESILAYRGDLADPQWVDKEPEHFTAMCNVIADTSTLARSLPPEKTSGGTEYYCMDFDVVLLFGLTELKAQISWKDKGEEQRSPAFIVYDD